MSSSKETVKIGKFDVEKSKILGQGGFGCVYLGKNRHSGDVVAVKQCVITDDAKGAIALKEIKNFQHITPHKHIVKMLDFDYASKSFWIVMEYCDLGDLNGYMQRFVLIMTSLTCISLSL